MTTQPERIPLDDLTSDALDTLYDRLEARGTIIRACLGKHRTKAARLRELEAEVTRLTAGQCLDSRAMCGCGRPDPGPCQPCPTGSPSLHCACACTPTKETST